jgi:tetratricopeptide (TPR) repeat protein
MRRHSRRLRSGILIAALCIAVAVAFSPAILGEYVFDDLQYIVGNTHVTSGLNLAGLRWALTSTYASNWHPLTWLSHQADSQLFGPSPLGPHVVNILLHAANASLLFLFLRAATGAFWRSACVAALFALHPLRVETVAWVSQRKDLLATLFWLLALGAYVRYARRPAVKHLILVAGLFLLALLAKPMAVTLPAQLLLLDAWPLGRLRIGFGLPGGEVRRSWARALAEKSPLFLLAAASAAVTYFAQLAGGSVVDLQRLPFLVRFSNAVLSYPRYLAKAAWPAELAVYYPHPEASELLSFAAAAALVAFSFCALRAYRTRPFLAVGWLWFLGTLVPVLGLVQVGGQAMADRYTYVPLVGVFVAATWLAWQAASQRPRLARTTVSAAILILLVLAPLTFLQARIWRDNITLFRHAVAVTKADWVMEENLGVVLFWSGRHQEALEHLRRAVALEPSLPKPRFSLSRVLLDTGQLDEAEHQLRATIQLNPNYPEAHFNLCSCLARQGRTSEALPSCRMAARLMPDNPNAHYMLGQVSSREHLADEALAQFRVALRLDPQSADASYAIGLMLARKGRLGEAEHAFRETLRIAPGHPGAQSGLQRLRVLKSGAPSGGPMHPTAGDQAGPSP